MNKLELTDEQIVDLIFERKINIGELTISSKNSCMTILARLEERIEDSKIFRRQHPVFEYERTGS